MKIIFLGTNGWFDTDTGSAISTLIDTKDKYIILDAGNGIYKADKYMKEDKPVYLFLSHFHIDHIAGLHVLAKFKFKSLNIFGQPGTKAALETFLDDKFSIPLNKLPFRTAVTELDKGWHDEPFKLQCLPLKHSTSCFGYRFEIEGKIVSYCTDTGYCREVLELSKNADLAIFECALASGEENPDWPHLNPETASRLAKEAKVKKLVLTHFDANVYKTLQQRKDAEKKAKETMKNTTAAADEMSMML
jgi:ribonuclease BN (tRNA processing enzyme)